MRLVKTALAASLLALALPSFANVVLNFDDLADGTKLGTNYASKGFNFQGDGWVFGAADHGGSGNYFNNPSSPNALGMFGTNTSSSVIINVTNGFGSWFKAALTETLGNSGAIYVYSGLNGKDAQGGNTTLAFRSYGGLVDGADGCGTSGTLCNWIDQSLTFSGVAYSVKITGGNVTAFFDNLDFGDKPGGSTHLPEPAGLALAASALGLAAIARRRRQG